jgi:hypothetical protein
MHRAEGEPWADGRVRSDMHSTALTAKFNRPPYNFFGPCLPYESTRSSLYTATLSYSWCFIEFRYEDKDS